MYKFLWLILMCSPVVATDQPLDTSRLCGRFTCKESASVTTESPTFFFKRDTEQPHAVLTISHPADRLTLTNDAGETIVEISLKDGTVRVAKTGKDDEAARRFWKAIQATFNAPKCRDVR